MDRKVCALEEVTYWLKRGGLDQHEVDILLAMFLEQEAQLYIDCMALVENKEETATA